MQRTKILSDKERFIRDVAERLKREAHELRNLSNADLHALWGSDDLRVAGSGGMVRLRRNAGGTRDRDALRRSRSCGGGGSVRVCDEIDAVGTPKIPHD